MDTWIRSVTILSECQRSKVYRFQRTASVSYSSTYQESCVRQPGLVMDR